MKALIVEQDEEIRNHQTAVLQRRGYVVETTASAAIATDLCKKELFDVVVVSRYLPDGDAMEICRQIRQAPQGDDVVILLTASRTRLINPSDAIDAGATDLIQRPLDDEVLDSRLTIAERRAAEYRRRRAVEGQLETRAHQQAAIAQIGQLALGGQDIPTLAQETTAIIARTMQVPFCDLLQLEPEHGCLRLTAGIGWEHGAIGTETVKSGIGTQTHYTLSCTSPLVIDDLMRDKRFIRSPLLEKRGVVSGVSLVVQGQDGPYGLLGAWDNRRRVFLSDDIHFLQSVANLLGMMVKRFHWETALRQSEERFRAMVEWSPNGLLLVDENGKILLASSLAETLLGCAPGGLIGQEIDLFVPERFRLAHPMNRARFVSSPSTRLMGAGRDLKAMRKDGTEFPVEIGLSPLRTSTGMQVVCNLVDITERKRLEEQFIQSQKMESIGRLAGGLAHDFNNLLSVILTNCGLLLRSNLLDSRARSDLESIRSASERATSLTNQLLAISRRQVFKPKVIDLTEVVTGIEEMVRRLIGEDLDLIIACDPGAGNVKADPSQVVQVIVNLVVNARDAMPKGGRLTVETGNTELDAEYCRLHTGVSPGPYVQLTVSDTGIGMDEDTRLRIFEPFFTTKERGKGTGLGLPTALGIVKQSSGHMWVYSEPGRGSTFKIYLPRVFEEAVPTVNVASSSGQHRGTATILVVEDAEMVRDAVRKILESSGYTMLLATNGPEAIEASSRYNGPIHLLLTDIVMPQMSGRELAEVLIPKRPQMKVLFMSGYTDSAVVYQEMLSPGTAFIQKPFSVDSLTRKIIEVLQEPTAADAKPVRVLVIEDEEDLRRGICFFLEDEGYHPVEASNAEEARFQLQTNDLGLILTDLNLFGRNDAELYKELLQDHPHLPLVVMSGSAPVLSDLIDAQGRQPAGCLRKPFDKNDLVECLSQAMRRRG
ncbi:MAG: response regulator [Candidatus Wallbacteria bacterium]|nr:response regulator [Candidatus Wallbacteria bacterium]